MMQSIEEHQVIPKREAAGMLVRELRKWRRVQNLDVEHHQKQTKRT
jgi:hypothetical protein